MSVQQEIADILGPRETIEQEAATEHIQSALQEVATLLSATGDSLSDICARVEKATTRKELREAFRPFNNIMGLLTETMPRDVDDRSAVEALGTIPTSVRFKELLTTQASVAEVVSSYKTLVIKDLAVAIRHKNEQLRFSEEQDDALFDRWLPRADTSVRHDIVDTPVAGSTDSADDASSKKRGVSTITGDPAPLRIPKKQRSKIPALASLDQIVRQGHVGISSKKAFFTREKLRAGICDPKGLLDLGDSSTNALERTKKLELLKCAGFDFNSHKGSFSERLNAATLNLDLGMTGHSMSDTLLFGAKVLSTSGILKPKHVSDIENSQVNDKTTWTHQNTYSKMMTAGCLNQAKRIVGKYDDVLFGPPPEAQIESAHRSIREFLSSEGGKPFVSKVLLDKMNSSKEHDITSCDNFIKKLIGLVPPIIPLALRNKSLDGSYLRTALHFLGVTEILFKQYEANIRGQANPAGFVGMCNAMHAEFERCTYFDEELRAPRVFCNDMRAQYQTSFGLCKSFTNDSGSRKKSKRAATFGRSSPFSQQARFSGRGSGRGQLGYATGSGFAGMGRGQTNPVPIRGRGVCYSYLSGNCGRGDSCRFLH